MAKPGKWYRQGYDDARYGMCDPPWQPGHRDHENYMEGHRDAHADLDREAEEDSWQAELDREAKEEGDDE